ncbi:MAG: RluA family pseudouridine synthase, partial [Bacteroidales bacterium]
MHDNFNTHLETDSCPDAQSNPPSAPESIDGRDYEALTDEITAESADLYEHHRIIVDKGQAPMRIDKFLTHRLENVSRNKIQNAADAGSIRVNGKAVKSSYKIKPLDEISVVMASPPRDTTIIPENIPLSIVYEDDALLVVNKPAGMVVHPGFNNYSGTLVHALAWHLKDLPLFQSGELRPGLVHRIDKDTSGLLVVAKTEFAMAHLAKQFFDHTTHREYQALVWGEMAEKEGTFVGNLGRNPYNRVQMWVFADGDEGKPAITHYKVLERFGYVSLVSCRLETGRTHQIRAHFRHTGHPLFADTLYGGMEILRGTTFTKYKQFVHNCFKLMPRQALHARMLGFIHPVTAKPMQFEVEMPSDMAAVV